MADTQTQTEKTDAQTEVLAGFLAICPPKRLDKVTEAITTLMNAAAGEPLYNTEYKDAKYWLDRAIDEAWKEQVQKPYLWGKGGDNAESDLDMYLGSVSYLRDVLSRLKKLGKCKPTTNLSKYSSRKFQDVDPECVAAILKVLEGAYPVALMVQELKSQGVKGRKPSKPSKAKLEALAKEAAKRTCPCCFRAMALDNHGKVVRHGWQEAGGRRVGQYGNAWHVGECFGVGYKPFEVSCDGTKGYLDWLQAVLKDEEEALERLNARPSEMHYEKRVRRNMRWESEIVTVKDDGKPLERSYGQDKTYADVLLDAIYKTEQGLKMLRQDITTLEQAIENWEPKE